MERIFRDADGSSLAPHGSVVVHRRLRRRAPRAIAPCWRTPRRARAGAPAAAGGAQLRAAAAPALPGPCDGAAADLAAPDGRACWPRSPMASACCTSTRSWPTPAPRTSSRRVLVERLAVREVWVGPGFRFGHARQRRHRLLQAIGAASWFRAAANSSQDWPMASGSAHRIRTALAAGRFEDAAALLGRPFAMRATWCAARNSAVSWVIPPPTCACAGARPGARHLRRARARRRPAPLAGGGQPRHAADGQRRRAPARGASVRLRRRPLRPGAVEWNSWRSCATS